MRLYEIWRVAVERAFLKELQASAIDQELQQTAAGIGASTAARAGDASGGMGGMGGMDQMADPGGGFGADPSMGMGGMGDPGMPQAAGQPGLEPDPSMMAGDGLEGAEELETKKIDSLVLSQVRGMEYFKYDHGNSVVSPEKIITMELDELNNLRTGLQNLIRMKEVEDKVGMFDDSEYLWYTHMREFVDKVLDIRKRSDQPVKKKRQGKTAKWEQKPESKNSKTKQYRKPPKPKGA